jgi:hypothetical protein
MADFSGDFNGKAGMKDLTPDQRRKISAWLKDGDDRRKTEIGAAMGIPPTRIISIAGDGALEIDTSEDE